MENQRGFQPQSSDSTGEAFSQGGFQPSNGFASTGFQPTETGFGSQTGFRPQGKQEVRVDSVDIQALREAITGARERLEKAEEVLKKLEFLPSSSNDPGFDNNGF